MISVERIENTLEKAINTEKSPVGYLNIMMLPGKVMTKQCLAPLISKLHCLFSIYVHVIDKRNTISQYVLHLLLHTFLRK